MRALSLIAGMLWTAAAAAQPDQTVSNRITCAPQTSPQDVDLPLKRIAYDLNTGKSDDALALVKGLLASRPDSASLQTALGEIYYRRAELGPAIEALNRAIQLDPCHGRARYFAWRLEALSGKTAEALKQLELAHRLAPEDQDIQRTWATEEQAAALEAAPNAPVVKELNPPLLGFFARSIDCDGIAVRGSARVDPMALVLACGKVRRELEHIPDARKRMVRAGSELHVIGEREMTSDLPENRRFRGAGAYRDAAGADTDIDLRTRGVGGLMSSCGEENLLGLPGDRYFDGEDICTHEFSHDIMNIGFTDRQRGEIESVWKAAVAKGLWKGGYEAVNAREYWASLTMWYFGSHGQFLAERRPEPYPAPGPEGLKAYDPDGFALLERLYGGGK